MGRRLILDTNVLIDLERGRWTDEIEDGDDLAMAAITVAEYRLGIELADGPARAKARTRALARILDVVTVLDYGIATAEHHARVLAAARRAGRPRGAHDLLVAAHAAESSRLVASRDARARFGDLPGVEVLELTDAGR